MAGLAHSDVEDGVILDSENMSGHRYQKETTTKPWRCERPDLKTLPHLRRLRLLLNHVSWSRKHSTNIVWDFSVLFVNVVRTATMVSALRTGPKIFRRGLVLLSLHKDMNNKNYYVYVVYLFFFTSKRPILFLPYCRNQTRVVNLLSRSQASQKRVQRKDGPWFSPAGS
jgi:hypothetical protein